MKLRQPARKQPTLRGSCRRPRSIGGGSWRKLSPMPQCKLFGETSAGLLDPIDLQHPALGRTWTRPLGRCRHFCRMQPHIRAVRRCSPAIGVMRALNRHVERVFNPRTVCLAILTIGTVSIGSAAAQTYDPAYPVCMHVYRLGANYYECR